MNEEQAAESVKWIKRAISGDAVSFALIATASDGRPALFVGKKATDVMPLVREEKKTATDKRTALGEIRRDSSGEIVIAVTEGMSAAQVGRIVELELAVGPDFKNIKSLLKKMAVVDAAVAVVPSGAPTRGERGDLGPGQTTTGTPGGSEGTTGGSGGAPPLDNPGALIEKIRSNTEKFRSNPAVEDEKLRTLLERIAQYRSLGGTEDLGDLQAEIEHVLAARTEFRSHLGLLKESRKRLAEVADWDSYERDALDELSSELSKRLAELKRLRTTVGRLLRA